MAVTTDRQLSSRKELNKKRTVSMIYKMCYCLSQLCNIMQVDHALYLNSNCVNQEGMDTEYQLGNTCSRKTKNLKLNMLSDNHQKNLENFFSEAIKNEWLLVLIIDDFTKIHTNRRPNHQHISNVMSMCTIVIKAFTSLKAIKLPKNISKIHDPMGVNIKTLIDDITAPQSMALLSSTYSSTMPHWLTKSFFTPDLERHILEEHLYCDDSGVRHMRTMDDLHLINFVELQLKSKEEFATAYDVALAGRLTRYLKKFVVVQPGDWPCQFYCRQIVYESLPLPKKENKDINISQAQSGNIVCDSDSSSMTPPKLNVSPPAITSLIPIMGPLHISLNSREHVFISFKPFFKKAYSYLFPGCTLSETPKPWRINLVLETVYGGWTLIREKAKALFQSSKDLQYGTLLNLLDNYLPLVLSIYTITFKTNNFKEYYNAMVRIWVMFVCLKRRHYNKAPLVWLSCTSHWGKNYTELYDHFTKWPTIFDEYPVENTHSILRAQTKPSDTAEKLTTKAKSIFESKQRQGNFRSIFTPPKQFNFSQQQLQFLKVKCAQFLTMILSKIHSQPNSASMTKEKKPRYVCLPDIFGSLQMKYSILPLGFNSATAPNENCRCDHMSCTVNNPDAPWQLFQGCWHSYHKTCLNGSSSCPLCRKLLTEKIEELGKVAKEAILHPKPGKDDQIAFKTSEADLEEKNNKPGIPESIDIGEINETVSNLNVTLSSLKPPPQPSLPHTTQPEAPHAYRQNSKFQQAKQSNSNKECPKISKKCSEPRKDFSNSTNEHLKSAAQTYQYKFETATRNDLPGITEWLLPTNISQTRIFGKPQASNACTIISTLVCRSFLKGQLHIPSTASLEDTIHKYKQIIMTGNVLYKGIHLPQGQPNLEVCQVLSKIPDLKLKILQDLGFFYGDEIYKTLCQLLQCEGRQAGVLILPPDKSVAVLANNNNIAIFDSHEHGASGGLIAVCRSNVKDLLNYLQTKDLLNGCNFSVLSADN